MDRLPEPAVGSVAAPVPPSPPLRGRGVGGEGAPHPQPLSSEYRGEGRHWLALAPLLLTLACGCASSQGPQGSHTTGLPAVIPGLTETPAPAVTTVAVMWSPRVITGVDPAHNGAPMAGLAGRVWLFSSDFKENPIADGKLVVELWCPPPGQPQRQPCAWNSGKSRKTS